MHTVTNDSLLFVITDVARAMRVSDTAARNFVRDGRLVPVYQTVSGIKLFAQHDVDRLLAERAEERVRAMDAAEQARARAIASAAVPR